MKNRKIIPISLAISTLLFSSESFASEDIIEIAAASGCLVCHSIQPLNPYNDPNAILPVGPAYESIAIKYKKDKEAYDKIMKVIKKGDGPYRKHWESAIDNLAMPPNVLLSDQHIDKLVKWILSLTSETK